MAVLACVHVRIHVPCEWMLLQTLSSHCQAAEPPEPPGRWYPPNPLLCRWRRWRCRRVRAWIGMRRRASSSSRELDLDASASGPGLNPFKDLIKVLYVCCNCRINYTTEVFRDTGTIEERCTDKANIPPCRPTSASTFKFHPLLFLPTRTPHLRHGLGVTHKVHKPLGLLPHRPAGPRLERVVVGPAGPAVDQKLTLDVAPPLVLSVSSGHG